MTDAASDILAIVLIGVSASGKTTIAEALARQIGFAEEDGDDFHPPGNVEKMRNGIALTDEDRWPWLHAIADSIDRHVEARKPVVIACSALRRAYRDILVHGRKEVRMVYLKGSRKLIADRISKRHGHFMPASLLKSQFDTLEPPQPDEHITTIDIRETVEEIVNDIVSKLHLPTATQV